MPSFLNFLRTFFGQPQVVQGPQLGLPTLPSPQLFPGANMLAQAIVDVCAPANPIAVAAAPLETLAGVGPSNLGMAIHQSSSSGASSSTDPMPTSVLGGVVHRYLTLADIARLESASRLAKQEINQHGQDYVQTLLSTDVAQLPPVILNELILIGISIQLPSGAFLNRLSDAAFQRHMALQTNLRADNIIGLDNHHISLLSEQQLLGALINGRVGATRTGLYGVGHLYEAFMQSRNFENIQLETAQIFPILEIYYSAHPENSHNFAYLVAQTWQAGVLRINEEDEGDPLLARLYQYHGADATGHVNSDSESISSGGSDGSLRRLKVIFEDIAGSKKTLTNIGVDDFRQTQLETNQDHDWFGIVLLKGSTYTFRMNKLGGTLDTYLALRDAQGNQITYNDDSDGTYNSRITFTAEKSGVYYLDASSYASRSSGSYEICSNLDLGAIDSNKGQYTSVLTTEKKNQLFKIDLKAGQKYEFLMNKEPTNPSFDAYLYLRDANKNVITRDDDSGGGRNSKISYTAESDGVYFLDASSYKQHSLGMFTVMSHHVI